MKRVTKSLLSGTTTAYELGGTTYTVQTKFINKHIWNEYNLRNKMKRIVESDFIPLTITEEDNTMAEEYMCLTAGKEDYAVKKET